MHSRIFCIDKVDDYELYNMMHGVADYVMKMHPSEIEEDLTWLSRCYSEIFKTKKVTIRDDEEDEDVTAYEVTVSKGDLKEVLRAQYKNIEKIVNEMDFSKFLDSLEIYKLQKAIEDEFTFYFYNEWYGLLTADSFLRHIYNEMEKDKLTSYTFTVKEMYDYHY